MCIRDRLIPVYGEVTEFTVEKIFYSNEEKIVFIGSENEGNQLISVVVVSPNGKEDMVVGAISNSEGSFKTTAKNIENVFSQTGTYYFTAFTDKQIKQDGITIELTYNGNKVTQPTKSVLQLNSISDKTVEVEKTITFTAVSYTHLTLPTKRIV